MNARQHRKAQKAWINQLIEEDASHPQRDTLAGVQREDGGYVVFGRERGCESGHRSFRTVDEVIEYLSPLIRPPG